MTEIRLIFRFHISENVYPSVESIIVTDKKINIVSGNRIKNEFLKSESTLSKEINKFINEGMLIPTEYWCPFWTALIEEGQLNLFISLIGDLEKFKQFEKCIEDKNYKLTEIIYLKLNEIDKLTDMAQLNYGKMFDDPQLLKKFILDYEKTMDELILYAEGKYKNITKDFFESEIII